MWQNYVFFMFIFDALNNDDEKRCIEFGYHVHCTQYEYRKFDKSSAQYSLVAKNFSPLREHKILFSCFMETLVKDTENKKLICFDIMCMKYDHNSVENGN